MPNTVISPSVSKPRKSTRITFTTLVPPPSGSDSARISDETVSNGRVITAYTRAAVPPPAASAIAASRHRRRRERSTGDSSGR